MSNATAIRPAESEPHSFEELPFVGKGNWWAVPRRGGYGGGDMTGAAAAMAYLKFLHDDNGQGDGFLQHIAFDMLGRPRSESLRGQAVGFFSHLDKILRQFAPLLDIKQDKDQTRAKFRRGLTMNGPRTAAYIKERLRGNPPHSEGGGSCS